MLSKEVKTCRSYFVATLLLLCIAVSQTVAFSPLKSYNIRRINNNARPTNNIQMSTAGDIADIEEITNFASENGVTLSFTTFGPGEYSHFCMPNDKA
jgi:plastocyanin